MENNQMDNSERLKAFEALRDQPWQPVMSDSCKSDWREKWFLDGMRASVQNTPQGMVFSAGPVAQDSGSHSVLWTRESFEGDIRIEFDYERLDTINRYVNILYFHATGKGEGPYTEDITEWSHMRHVPYMPTYFNNMKLLHISFAAFGNDNDDPDDYVRMRRYPVTETRKFNDLPVPPDYDNTGFFEPGAPHHFVVIKKGHDIYMHLTSNHHILGEKQALFHWNTSDLPDLTHGRIGIRQMGSRCSLYRDFKVLRTAQ